MGNPLFNMFSGTVPGGSAPPDMNDAMNRLRQDPAQALKSAGYSVPDEIARDPQAAVMHLLQTGQIGGPLWQKIQPMINNLFRR